MNLTPMRFRDYTWPHNPETYEIQFKRKVAAHKIPYGRAAMQDFGITFRTMRGQGTFAGKGAYDELKKLAKTFYQTGPGTLVHPVWQTSSAYFVSLELLEEPLPDYVHYAFEFWEDTGISASGMTAVNAGKTASAAKTVSGANFVTVRRGDTLWAIARRAGRSLAEVLALNPQIKNPNLIYPGNQVRVR